MSDDPEERENELLALQSIFTPEEFVRGRTKSAGEIRVSVRLPEGFTVSIKEGMKMLFSVLSRSGGKKLNCFFFF